MPAEPSNSGSRRPVTPAEDALSLIGIVCHVPEFRYFINLRDATGSSSEVVPFPRHVAY